MKETVELVRGWLRKAANDRVVMEVSINAGVLDAACFHAQQAAEKYLKAFLLFHKTTFPYTHNLTRLIELCVGLDASFQSLLPKVAPLTPYVVELRYDESFLPTREVAEQARSSALEVQQMVLSRLPKGIAETAS